MPRSRRVLSRKSHNEGRDVNYRVATIDDCPQLARLRWEFQTSEGGIPIEDEASFVQRYLAFVRDALQSERLTYWIAESPDGEIVAQMAVFTIRSIPRPSRGSDQWGYLTDCYTRPAFRNQGIGQQLLDNVAAWAAARDLEMLVVWPSERSQPFYERAGFGPENEVRMLRLRDYDGPHSEQSFVSMHKRPET